MALILDTGPLYASLDRSDADYAACRALIETAEEALVIPAPVLVEVDYWIHQRLHPGALVALLADIEAGAYLVADLEVTDYARVRELCDRYADADVGFVDAAVLAIVERLGEPKLATLDHRHFGLLRPRHRESIELLPALAQAIAAIGHPKIAWDTSALSPHLQDMVGDLTFTGSIAATTVAEAAAGDADALARIVAAHHDDMARIAFVICGDQDLAQDAVQAAWPQAWRKLGDLRDPERLRPWLMSVAANEARQVVRRQRRHVVVEIEVTDVGSRRSDPGADPGLVDLAVALRRLAPEERALLALRYVAGFDAGEIGRALGMTASGVRSKLSRLVARLRSELDDA